MKKLTTIFVGVLLTGNLFGQYDITFSKVMNIGVGGSARGIRQTSDEGYIVHGEFYASDTSSAGCFLSKLSRDGVTLWTKTFSYYSRVGITDIALDSADNIYVTGSYRVSPGYGDVLILKADGNGNVIWCKAYGGFDADGANSITITSDNGIVMTGLTQTFENPSATAATYIVKTDLSGNFLWSKFNFDPAFSQEYFIREIYLNKYVSVGNSCNSSCVSFNVLDNNGNVITSKSIDYSDFTIMSSVAEYEMGGYLIAGATAVSGGPPNLKPLLIALDNNFNLLWAKKYTIPGVAVGEFYSIVKALDGGYVAVFEPEEINGYDHNMGIVKLDANGNALWARIFDSHNNMFPLKLIKTGDGGYAEAGEIRFGVAPTKPIVIKTNNWGIVGNCYVDTLINLTFTDVIPTVTLRGPMYSNGTLTNQTTAGFPFVISDSLFCVDSIPSASGFGEAMNIPSITVYPNPANEQVTLELSEAFQTATATFYGADGMEVDRIIFSGQKVVFFKRQLPGGLYFYRILSENGLLITGKLIFE